MIPIIIHIFHASPLAANCLRTCVAALGNLLPHSNCSNMFALLLQGRKNASHRSIRSIQDFPWATTCTCHACRPHHCIIFAFVLNLDNVTAMYMILAFLIGCSESSFCFAHGPTKLLPGILSLVQMSRVKRFSGYYLRTGFIIAVSTRFATGFVSIVILSSPRCDPGGLIRILKILMRRDLSRHDHTRP